MTVEPTFALPESAHDVISGDAERLTSSLHRHVLRTLAPNSEKNLRPFTSAEAAQFLGVSPGHLRKMHSENKIPEVHGGTPQRKLYTAQEIQAIREALAATSRNPHQFLPGRKPGDKLQVIAFTGFKGGSSKTTSAITTASALALRGYRVLLLDVDPQASASTMMGLQPELNLGDDDTVYDVLRYDDPASGIFRKTMQEVIRKTYMPNLDICPGGLILSEYETETPTALKNGDPEPFYMRMKVAIASVDDDYDVVIIDCPPQLGFLTLTAMSAATGIVIPIIPNMIDVASLAQFMTMTAASVAELERAGFQFNYDFVRYLLSRYEPTDGPQTQVAAFLRNMFPGRVMTSAFLKSTAIADAGLTNETIFEVDRNQINRATFNRAMESVGLVVDELEQDIRRAWGREVS